jgi:hypothetical protein
MPGKLRTFKFSVAGTPPKFTYAPAADWTYGGEDAVRFVTDAGPFTLDVTRKDAQDLPGGTRPFQALVSKAADGKHVAQTFISDGLSATQRDQLRVAHQTPSDTFGFIARYRYKIEVTLPGGTKAYDDQKNGEYHC